MYSMNTALPFREDMIEGTGFCVFMMHQSRYYVNICNDTRITFALGPRLI